MLRPSKLPRCDHYNDIWREVLNINVTVPPFVPAFYYYLTFKSKYLAQYPVPPL
jgi:hypothetical protein